jgi:hypothetical protein
MENAGCRLAIFIKVAVCDERVNRTQLSLFVALLICWLDQNCVEQIKITRKSLMEQSKIPAISTYHRCLKELVALGYIDYKPTFDRYSGSKVKIMVR